MGTLRGGRRLWRLTSTVAVEDGTIVLILEGRLGHVTVAELKAASDRVLAGGPPVLVLDLSGVDYLSSAALRVLKSLAEEQLARGSRLTLRAPSPAAQLSLALSGHITETGAADPARAS